MKKIILSLALMFVTACASTGGGKSTSSSTATPDLDTQLKVTSVPGKLKAKLTLKNTSSHEILVKGLDSQYFSVATIDNKPMVAKGVGPKTVAPLRLKPGQSVETAFNLQDSYSFWDRLTKYRIQFDNGDVKSNVVQVWY